MRRLISSRQPAVDPAAFRQRILLRQANEKAVDPVRTRRRRRSAPPECRPAVNPATGETLKTYGDITDEEAERCLAAAHASYRLTDFGTRAGWMRRAADILDGECDQVAAMMTAEMGKTFAAARQEVGKRRSPLPLLRRPRRGVPCRRAGRCCRGRAEQAYVRYESLGRSWRSC